MSNTNIYATIITNTPITATITPNTQVTATVTNGARGASAYEVWLSEGHTGTTADFLNWLKSDSFIHSQMVSASEWVITHNLGKYPSVTIVDSANTTVVGEVEYITTNELKVSFNAAFSGKAYLN